MSDFDSIVNPDPTPDPEPEQPAEVAEEVTPEPEPQPEAPAEEPLWKKAGFDDEDSFIKKVSNLTLWEREVQRRASEAGKQPTAQPTEPSDDPWAKFDADADTISALKAAVASEAQRVAQSLIASEVAPRTQMAEEVFRDGARKTFEGFAASNNLETDELTQVMDAYGLWPQNPSIAELNAQLEAGAAILKGMKAADIEAERERIRTEERERIMKELAEQGAEVTAVSPKKPSAAVDERDPIEKGVDFLAMFDFVRGTAE